MSREVHPAVMGRLIEKYQPLAEELARKCIQVRLRENDLKESGKFAEFNAMTPANIIDWFKRRTARSAAWRAVGYEIVPVLMEIRAWSKTQESDVQRQAQILCAFVDMMWGYFVGIKSFA